MSTKKLWKKIIAVALAVLLAFSSVPVSYTVDTYAATATKLYLKPNSNWLQADAWFAAYFFGNGEKWVSMTGPDSSGYYQVSVPAGYPSVIFCRMNPASTAMNWDNKWTQTGNLTVPTNGTNCFTLTSGSWDSGTWSTKIFGYYVAGSSGLCGENWSTTADPMTANSNGTYSITFQNVAAGTYEFKVVANGDYSAGAWPSSNYSLTVATASDVTITFTPSSGNISVTQTPLVCTHSWSSGKCTKCGATCSHTWSSGKCSTCGMTCSHSSHNTSGVCTTCGSTVSHTWSATTGKCTVCSKTCSHSSHNTSGKCTTCGYAVGHSYTSKVTTTATCTTDGVRTYTCSVCTHSYTETISSPGHTMVNGTCSVCGYSTITTYNVTFSGTNVTSNGASTANDAANYTATLTPASGYHLPASITVKSGNTTLTSGTHYTYNSSTGALTIYASAISGKITITAVAEKDYYIVAGTQSLTGSNWDTTDTDNLMTKNADGTYSITYNNVAVGNYEVKAVKNGSYDNGQWPYSGNKTFTVSKTSTVTVTLNLTTNELTVDVVPVVNSYNVTFTGTNVTSNGASTANDAENYTATLTPASGYHLPASITVKSGNTTLTSGTHYSYNSSTGALTIYASAISGNITITAKAEQDYYIVVGTKNLTGSDWNTSDTNNLMTQNADGTYSITYNNVAAGDYAVKAVKNGSYAIGEWPQSGNKSFTVAETSKVTVTLNLTTNELTVDVVSLVSHYEVTFSGTNVTSNGASTANDAANYTATLTPASGYHLPASITVKSGNTTLTSGTHYTYNSSTGALTINASAISGNITITAKAEQDYYIVVGTENLTGSDWDTTDTDNQMTQNADGTYSITYNNVAAGDYAVKAVKNGSYAIGEWPQSGNKSFTVSKTSTVTVTLNLTTNELDVNVVPVVNSYNVTFTGTNVTSNGASTANDAENYTATLTPASGYQLPASITVKSGNTTLTSGTDYSYNSSTGVLTINASAISGDIAITAEAEQDYYIVVGTENLTGSDWNTSDTNNLMTQNADGTYSITYNNVAAGDYEIKAVKNGSYDNGQWPYSGNKSFTVDETSKVIVTLDLTANELIVDVISLVSHYEVTFNGTNVTSNGSVAADNEKDYSATLTVSAGYKLPSAITVKVGDSTLSSGDYTYNSSTGALTIPASHITGNITITAVAEESVYMVVGSTGLTSSNWDTTDTDNLMTKNADGTYTIVYSAVPAGTHEFKITENGDWKWPAENYVLNTKSTSKVTITYNPTTGEGDVKVESVYVRTDEIDLPANQVYYATVDLVDYLNNNRVENNQVKGYFTDNQGEWTGEEDAVFSYMNHLVSQQGNYTYPLYFGPLHYIKSRYSKVVGSTAWENLSNWSTAANVAFGIKNDGVNINGSGVAQGLVRNTLDANGNLVDPSTNTPLLYFNQEAAESWTNNGHKVMAYYPNLQFPFVMSYDAKTRVTTYSYDSATDYAVYYDYTNSQLYASNTHVKDYMGNTGFYPLNAPTDADNQVNNGFGAKFTIDFTVGEDGYLINRDENGVIISKEPVTFEFTGDDDVWVFIDGVLVLDMGGAHAKANGKINFATREATVSNAASVGNSYKITSGTTYQQSTYSGQNLKNYIYDGYMERATPDTGDVSATFESLGLNFDYGSVHTMTVFYMERGMFESNFSMEFTMIPVPSGLTLSKNLNDSEINKGLLNTISRADDLSFTLEATSPSSTSVAFSKYTLLDKYTGYSLVKNITGTTSGRTYSAAIDGINNYVYASSFVNSNGEDAFIPGTSFTITETTKGIFTYTGTSWVIYDANNGYINITDSVKTTDNTSSNTAKFTMGTEGSATAYSYAVSFINKLALGNLQVVKNVSDASLNGVEFTFKVYIDLDGSRDNFSPSLYPGLVYTVDGTTYTSTDGTIIVPGGQTAVISGLPAGATYQVDEVIPSDAPWQQVSKSGDSGSITANGTASAEFTNAVNTIVENKTIYVEAGKATDYTISYNGQIADITDLTPGDGITATDNGDCLQVTGQDPDKQYTLTYEGRLEDGTIIRGSITVYTFRAMNKVYVFDFGLSSNLADTTYGYGLFQQNYLFNQFVSGESSALYAITGNGNTQTSITYTQGAAIQADGESSKVTFRPTAFMSKVETYSYTVHITASGETFDANNPETGCAVTGTIEVMPANSVYYEDNFNVGGSDASEKFIYSNSSNAPTTAPEESQSNDQSSNYGYDDAYLGDYRDSNDSATVLDHMEYTYFTFTGTGFDLDSRTTAGTAGMAVYVFKDTHKQEYLDYVTDLEYKGTLPSQPVDMVFVNNFYANGDLYQVPVVSVRLDECATYTVYIQCLSTSYASSVVIDGVRIYKPLKDTQYYASSEQNVIFSELRQLLNSDRGDGSNEVNDSKDTLRLAGIAGGELFVGTGKQSVVAEALIENPKLGTSVTTSADLNTVYKQGPNNEMYLPKNLGVMFTYSVTDSDWTLQLGAKAVTATNDAKSISIYVRVAGSDAVKEVAEITLSTATDMYYDLSQYLVDYSEQGKTYELFIISNSAASNNEFVSLTTVKYAGATLG